MLTAVVVVVGLSSWLVTGGIGRLFPSSPTEHSSPSPLPRFPACGATEIKLTGAYDDCAEVPLALKPLPCVLLGANLMNTLSLIHILRSLCQWLDEQEVRTVSGNRWRSTTLRAILSLSLIHI